MLETELKELALKEGSIRVGIARREAFSEAPPSADMQYLKPWANTVVSFAISKGTDWIEDYLGKVTRMVMRDNMHFVYNETYRIANVIASRLKSAGFRAHAIIPNGIYRPEHTFEKERMESGVLGPPGGPFYRTPMEGCPNFTCAYGTTPPTPPPHAMSHLAPGGSWTVTRKISRRPATIVIRYAAVRWRFAKNGWNSCFIRVWLNWTKKAGKWWSNATSRGIGGSDSRLNVL
jgi:hypothetical protein